MLAQAHEKNVYDELVKGELTSYLRDHRDAFDLIVSADTLVYFGALEDVITGAAVSLRREGSFMFTVEETTDAEATSDYCIKPHGYSHRRAYVERLLANVGLRSCMVQAELRMEAGAPVGGLVRATKPGARPFGENHA